MSSNQLHIRVAGALFMVAIISGFLGVSYSESVSSDVMQLEVIAESNFDLTVAALLQLIMGLSVAGIAIGLYPTLRRYSESLALTAVVFRSFEGILFSLCAYKLLSVTSLAALAIGQEGSGTNNYQLLVKTLLLDRHWIAFAVAAMCFCLGALSYYYLLFREKLIPHWLSLWGIVAILLHLFSAVTVVFGAEAFSTLSIMLALPILVNELILSIWLMLKGVQERI